MIILVYVTIGLLGLYLILGWKSKKTITIPGPKGWPLVGMGFRIKQGNIHEKFSRYAEQYGDIFKVNIFGNTLVVLNSAELVRKAYGQAPFKTVINDRKTMFFAERFLFGSQTITFTQKVHGNGAIHGGLRKAFTRGMHLFGEGRKEFEDLVQSELSNLVLKLEQYCGEEFEFEDLIRRSLINVMSIILVGDDVKNDDETFKQLWNFDCCTEFMLNQRTDALLTVFPFLRFLPTVYRDRYQQLTKSKAFILEKFFEKVKANREPGVDKGIINYLLDDQQRSQHNGGDVLVTDERIKALLLETFVAGVVTTVSTLCSTILCLVNHPEYQVKIQKELDKVVGRTQKPTLMDRKDCPMTEAVVMETLRYAPPTPLPFPHLCGPGIHLEGREIPANSLVMSNVWFIQHDEKIWGDPWTFRPERFLDDNGDIIPMDHPLRKNVLAFGTGRRQCIGEGLARSRLFMFVSTLLQRWTFELPPGKVVGCDPRLANFGFNFVCRPKPYCCKAVPRMPNE